MDGLAVVLMLIGLVLAPVVRFPYPYWNKKGEEISEKKLYGIRNRDVITDVCVRAIRELM